MRRARTGGSRTILILAAGLAAATLACAGGDAAPGAGTTDDASRHSAVPVAASGTTPAAGLIPIRNARVPMPGVLSGGQPTAEQIEAAAAAGYRTVINIRTAGEPGFEWEPDLVERLGMTYVHIPVGGADTLTPETVRAIDEALDAARARGPVLYHCASGNRIGASLALRSAWIEGAPPAEAFQYGLASGMTRLTPAIADVLGIERPPAR
jgi:uncharacterized protein (TIGR01244 family)